MANMRLHSCDPIKILNSGVSCKLGDRSRLQIRKRCQLTLKEREKGTDIFISPGKIETIQGNKKEEYHSFSPQWGQNILPGGVLLPQ